MKFLVLIGLLVATPGFAEEACDAKTIKQGRLALMLVREDLAALSHVAKSEARPFRKATRTLRRALAPINRGIKYGDCYEFAEIGRTIKLLDTEFRGVKAAFQDIATPSEQLHQLFGEFWQSKNAMKEVFSIETPQQSHNSDGGHY